MLFLSEGRVRFTHDRNQVHSPFSCDVGEGKGVVSKLISLPFFRRGQAAAYRLLPPDLRASTHSTIAKYLQQPSLIESHLFDAVDNELLAVNVGKEVEDEDELVRLGGLFAPSRFPLSLPLTLSPP